MTLLWLLLLLLGSLTLIPKVLHFWVSFFFLIQKICPSVVVLPLGKSEHVVVSVPIDFPYTQKRNVDSIAQFMTIVMEIGVVLAIS